MLCLLYLAASVLFGLSRARPAKESLLSRYTYTYDRYDVPDITNEKRTSHQIKPYVFIISQFQAEASVWYNYIPELLERPVPVPGFSFAYPNATCNSAGTICQLITGMGETNAAATLTALIFNSQFQLTETYFLIAGISGIDPSKGTTGTVTFARYAVQLDLTYEIDSRQISSNFTSGIIPLGNNKTVKYDPSIPANDSRSAYPRSIYGTEVYRLNDRLKDRFYHIGLKAEKDLVDAPAAQEYRALYDSNLPAAQSPRVISCDTQSSNTFWSGTLYEKAYNAYTQLLTNGSSELCTSQQEDNGTLEALLRGHLAGKVDYRRVAVMRSASDFTSAPRGVDEAFHLLETNFQGGFPIAVENLGVVGSRIVRNVVKKWTGPDGYKKGVQASKSMGSILVDV